MYTSCHACNDQDRITSYEPGSSISLLGADDFHMHLRDGAVLPFTVQCCAKQFDRAIVMPNIKPPVTSVALALAYRERILAALPAGSTFTHLMTMYMTDKPTPEIVREAKATGLIFGIKLYPAGATTNSDSGVTDISKLDATLEVMQEVEASITCGIYSVLSAEASVSSRTSFGGTAPERVREAAQTAREVYL